MTEKASERTPELPLEGRTFPLTEVASALQTFLDEHYRGVHKFIFENEAVPSSLVSLRPEPLGVLLRLLFRDTYWDGPIAFTISANTRLWELRIDLPEKSVFSRSALAEYVKAGRKAGVFCRAVKKQAGTVSLILSCTVDTPPTEFFARGNETLLQILNEVFERDSL